MQRSWGGAELYVFARLEQEAQGRVDFEQGECDTFHLPPSDAGFLPFLCLSFLSTPRTDPRELRGPWVPHHFSLLSTRVPLASFAYLDEALGLGVLGGPWTHPCLSGDVTGSDREEAL